MTKNTQQTIKRIKLVGDVEIKRLKIYAEFMTSNEWGLTIDDAMHKINELDAYLKPIFDLKYFRRKCPAKNCNFKHVGYY